jgi:hypothetical protein
MVPFEKKKLTIICQKQNSRTNIGAIQIVAHLKRFCLTYHLLKSDKKVIAPKVFHNTPGIWQF